MNVDKYYELRMASVFKGLNVKIDAVSVWIGGYSVKESRGQPKSDALKQVTCKGNF